MKVLNSLVWKNSVMMNKCHSILERRKMNSIDMQTAAVLKRELNTNRDDKANKEVVQWLEKRVAYYDELKKKRDKELPPP